MQSKFLIAAITFVMLAAIVVGCAGPSSSPETSSPPEIGDVVSGGIWEVEVISVKNETTLERIAQPGIPKMSWSAPEGYSFLVVEVQIHNTSTTNQEYHSSSLTLTDSENQVYTPVGAGSVNIAVDLVSYNLNVTWTATVSGETPSEYIVFAVPDDAEGLYFKFLDLPEIYLGQ